MWRRFQNLYGPKNSFMGQSATSYFYFLFFYLAIIVLLTTHLTKVLHTKRMLLKFVVFELIAQLDLVGIPQIFTLKKTKRSTPNVEFNIIFVFPIHIC